MLARSLLFLVGALLLSLTNLALASEVNTNFGEIISAVQNQNRTYIASKNGRIGSWWFTELKFEWSVLVPNPAREPRENLVTSLWFRSGLLLSTGKHAVHGWRARNGSLEWQFTAPNNAEVLESIFFDDFTIMVCTSDFKVYELNKQDGAVRRVIEANPSAKKFSVLLNEEDQTKDLVESFEGGRITITKLGAGEGAEPRKEFTAADWEFALVQDDGYLVTKKDTNRVVFTHVNSGGALRPHYFGENIIQLRSDPASHSVIFTGKKTKTMVVLREVNDTMQEWQVKPGEEFTIHSPTNSLWVSHPQRPVVKFFGPKHKIPMPSEGDYKFKRAWMVQGDRKTLLFTVGEDNMLGFWRHIEGFNKLQRLWILHQPEVIPIEEEQEQVKPNAESCDTPQSE